MADQLSLEHRKALQGCMCSNDFPNPELPLPEYFVINSDSSAQWPDQPRPLQLKVKFLNQIPEWCYNYEPIDTQLILTWANEWGKKVNGWTIFTPSNGGDAQVCVQFIEEGLNECYIGGAGQLPVPFMLLNLSSVGDDCKKYIVLHEFGHALGLRHEQQRSDFWAQVGQFFDKEKIMRDFRIDPDKQPHFDASNGYTCSKIDPKSVMNWLWVCDAYLKEEYNTRKKIKALKGTRRLTSEQFNLLSEIVGITEEPTEPSDRDKKFIKNIYYKNGYTEVLFCLEAGDVRYDDNAPVNVMTCQEVYVCCGSYNNWEKIKMSPKSGKHTVVLDLPPGRHEYKFLVDDKWCCHSDMPTTWNDYNSQNNVLNVTQKHISAHEDLKNHTGSESSPWPTICYD